MGIAENHVIEEWCQAVSRYHSLARGERLGELRGRRVRLLDDRGLHPLSLEIGRIMTCQALLPELIELDFDHFEVRRAAHHDAVEEYEHDVIARLGGGIR